MKPMSVLVILSAVLLMVGAGWAQTLCSQGSNGDLVCMGRDGGLSVMSEHSPGQGSIMHQNGTVEPYSIMPPPAPQGSGPRQPIPSWQRESAPSSSPSTPSGSSSDRGRRR